MDEDGWGESVRRSDVTYLRFRVSVSNHRAARSEGRRRGGQVQWAEKAKDEVE